MSKPAYFLLKPVKGRLVRDPKTRAKLPAKGARKLKSSFWIRRLRSGDVVEVKHHLNMTAELPIMTVEEPKTNG